MQWSSPGCIARALLAASALASLSACATRSPSDVDLASITLDDQAAAVEPTAEAVSRRPSVGSPIAQICAYPGGRQVLDQDLPGLTERPEYVFFSHLSLKSLQGLSKGQLKDDDIRKVAADLRALP